MVPNAYLNKMIIKNDLDKLNKVISIFSIIKNGNLGYTHLRPRCVDVLSYFLAFGFNDDTKDIIKHSIPISDANLSQIISELTKSQFLIKDSYNTHKRDLSPELKKIKEYFMDETNKNKYFLIKLME